MLKIGDVAPAFRLPAHTGETIDLGALQGRRALLWFYPMADTPG
jgi:peroxiredoxin Q/BCP